MFKQVIDRIKSGFAHIYLDKMGFGSGKQLARQWLKQVSDGTTVLDAGCGEGSIRQLLPAGARYIGVDMFRGDDSTGYAGWKHKPTVLADLNELPLPDACCDVVLFFQVLEHIRFPQKVLSELVRVMRPGAMMVVTSPFIHPIHHAPNDFFRYTKYGFEHLFSSCGLQSISIKPSGGYFRCLGNCLGYFISLYKSKHLTIKIILSPMLLWILILKQSINFLEYPLDMLDDRQEFVAGYHCICKKGA